MALYIFFLKKYTDMFSHICINAMNILVDCQKNHHKILTTTIAILQQ